MLEGYFGEKLVTKIDRYLRKEDTLLAKAIKGVCSLEGETYRNSQFKRGFEFTITLPVATLTIPISNILGFAAKLEDGGEMFFVQERIGKEGIPFKLTKIRAMKPGSESPESSLEHTPKFEPEADPRNTALGQKIRTYDIDEFPQFLQILKGEISLTDIRATPQYVIDFLKENRPGTFQEWFTAYTNAKPGLLNLHSAVSKNRKNDLKRHHYDMLYARKASLGLDLFIICRTSLLMLRKIEQKFRKKAKEVS